MVAAMRSGPYSLRRAFDAALFLGACAVSMCGSHMLRDAGGELRETQLGPMPLPGFVHRAAMACNARARDVCPPSELGLVPVGRAFLNGGLPRCFHRASCDSIERMSQKASLSEVRALAGGGLMYIGTVAALMSWMATRRRKPER